MSRLGVAKPTCNEAASAIGPSGQCGASDAPYTSAIAAIRRTSEMPPAWDRSGWTTATPASSAGRKSQREYSRSPVAIGTGEHSTRSRRCPPSSGTTGSSANSGEYGSSRGSSRRAMAGETRPWKSIARSRPGPRASRTAATRAMTSSAARGVSIAPNAPVAFIFTAL
jgi:hypothetical protein